ncbi:YecA family protein [Actinomycetospora atypica]|uniref:YecA family protein n=1 Tax=Actinomycetospora atypica TaxID=1290095 RepID=A0ABV9YHL8_9PSEU
MTTDDLDAYGADVVRVRNPRPVLDELIAAVDEDRIADPEDVPYALSLAASAAARLRDEARALDLSRRAVDAARGGREEYLVRGEYADLLLRFGHDEEGITTLRKLRQQLTRDPLADGYVIEPLLENGRETLAQEWLTAALETAVDIAERADPDTDEAEDAWEIVDSLASRRVRVRRGLGLQPDEADLRAEELLAAHDAEPDMVFWPQAAFATLVEKAPDLVEMTWDEHRAAIERELQQDDQLLVEVATPQLLEATLAGDETVAGEPGPALEWPPGRNEPCWCGSQVKYKKCCLPRGRSVVES